MESGNTTFPLSAGNYVAYLLRDGSRPYAVLAETAAFEVKPHGQSCPGQPHPAPNPHPSPPTPQPYPNPTPAPVHPTPAPHPTACEEYIETDKDCYLKGEAITVTFNQCDAQHNDWIGVYYSGDGETGEELGADFRFWLWACGTQYCSGTADSGTIVFDENDPRESGRDTWPLNVNQIEGYKVHIIRYDRSQTYTSYLASNTFVVLDEHESCDAPPSPPAPEPTPAPHPDPTPAPVPTPCVDSVDTDDTCYSREAGDDVVIDFETCDPLYTNWLGIYDAHDDPHALGEPLYWAWLCSGNTTGCTDSVESGTITIDNQELIDNKLYGEYRAHLVALANPSGSHYQAYASSDTFSIEKKSNRCHY